jgi:hypothetical protein
VSIRTIEPMLKLSVQEARWMFCRAFSLDSRLGFASIEMTDRTDVEVTDGALGSTMALMSVFRPL